MTDTTYDVYCGIDVGKTMHHAIALRPDGSRILSREIPQDEDQIRDLVGELGAHGSVIVVVDQPRNIGALPLAVARNCGADLAYLPGLRMRRIADLYAGSAKTDARDAYVIADAARTLPGTLVPIDSRNEVVEGLRILAGFDADLAVEENRLINRLRSLLLSIHPSLERAIGRHYGMAGNMAWLAISGHTEVEEVSAILEKEELSALAIRGDTPRLAYGKRVRHNVQNALKQALDPQNKFPEFQ